MENRNKKPLTRKQAIYIYMGIHAAIMIAMALFLILTE